MSEPRSVAVVGPHIFVGAEARASFEACGLAVAIHPEAPSAEALVGAARSNQVIVTWGRVDHECAAGLVEQGLQLLVLLSTGFEECIDAGAHQVLTSGGTTVCYTPGYATTSVAEFAICACLALRRRVLPWAPREGMGAWLGSDLRDSTAGVIGLGRIGLDIAQLCAALGVGSLLGTSRTSRSTLVEHVPLEELCARASSVFLAAGLDQTSLGLLHGEHILSMPPDAVLINVGRPLLFEPTSILDALRRRTDLRVLVDGDLPDGTQWADLRALENVEWTPHVAFNSLEALERCTATAATAASAYVTGGPLADYLAVPAER